MKTIHRYFGPYPQCRCDECFCWRQGYYEQNVLKACLMWLRTLWESMKRVRRKIMPTEKERLYTEAKVIQDEANAKMAQVLLPIVKPLYDKSLALWTEAQAAFGLNPDGTPLTAPAPAELTSDAAKMRAAAAFIRNEVSRDGSTCDTGRNAMMRLAAAVLGQPVPPSSPEPRLRSGGTRQSLRDGMVVVCLKEQGRGEDVGQPILIYAWNTDTDDRTAHGWQPGGKVASYLQDLTKDGSRYRMATHEEVAVLFASLRNAQREAWLAGRISDVAH